MHQNSAPILAHVFQRYQHQLGIDPDAFFLGLPIHQQLMLLPTLGSEFRQAIRHRARTPALQQALLDTIIHTEDLKMARAYARAVTSALLMSMPAHAQWHTRGIE